MYTLSVAPNAERDIARLRRMSRQDFERVSGAIRGLRENPRPHGVMKLKGSNEGYRIRAGNYRILYEIYDDLKIITITRVIRRTETTYRA